jgi:hypothetical protein
MKQFFIGLVNKFDSTVFGRMYIENFDYINKMLDELEEEINNGRNDERQADRMFSKCSNELNNLINGTYANIMNKCENVKELMKIWNDPTWTEASTFMKKLLIGDDENFKQNIWNGASVDKLVPEWRNVINSVQPYESEYENDNDVDSLMNIEDCESDIENCFGSGTHKSVG